MEQCGQKERPESQDTDAATVGSARSERVEGGGVPILESDVESLNALPEYVKIVRFVRNMERTSEGDNREDALRDSSCASAVSSEDDFPRPLIDLVHDNGLPEFSAEIAGPPSEVEGGGEELESGLDQSPFQVPGARDVFDEKEVEELAMTFAGYRLPSGELNLMDDDEFPIYDGSDSMLRSAFGENNGLALDGDLDSILSIQKSAISEEMDRADWEDINCTSITQLNHMEPLDNLVEEARADKVSFMVSSRLRAFCCGL